MDRTNQMLANAPSRGEITFPAAPPAAVLEQRAARGLVLGLLAVGCFSLTPVATRAAVTGGLSPLFVAAGRAFGAALLAAALLKVRRAPWPRRAHLAGLLATSAGCVVGFPLLMTWALARVPAAHAGTVIGVLPLTTAVVGVLRGDERPSWLFWAAGIAGSAVVVGFAWSQGGGRLQPADLALFGAVVAAAVGYAEGALLARTLGSWQTISWALVLGAPVTGLLTVVSLSAQFAAQGPSAAGRITASAWMGFGYVTVVSQFLGFFPWYRGLALGGVARVSQLQLLMPFLTLMASAVLLHESVTPATLGTALLVVAAVAAGRRASFFPRRKFDPQNPPT